MLLFNMLSKYQHQQLTLKKKKKPDRNNQNKTQMYSLASFVNMPVCIFFYCWQWNFREQLLTLYTLWRILPRQTFAPANKNQRLNFNLSNSSRHELTPLSILE